jgi:hypothetical protein
MMQKLAFVLLVLTCTLPLRADDNWIQNGDFSDGTNHWHGDLRSPADLASDNPLQASDPFTSKGMIIPLKQSSWCKVAQDFRGKIASGILTVTYMVSTDLAFSTKPDDYTNIPNQLGWGWKSFNTPPGDWMVFISALGDTKGVYYKMPPKLGSSAPQTFRIKVSELTPLEDQTLTLAFPPGTGTVVVLGVALTEN